MGSETLCTGLFVAVIAAGVLAVGWRYLRIRVDAVRATEAPHVAAWRAYAQARGLKVTLDPEARALQRVVKLHGTLDQVNYTLDTFLVVRDSRAASYTWVAARALESVATTFDLGPRTAFGTLLSHILDAHEPETGDAAFDARFLLRADHLERAHALLDAPTRKALLAFPRDCHLRWHKGAVELSWPGDETDPDALDAACRAVATLCRWRRDPQLYR